MSRLQRFISCPFLLFLLSSSIRRMGVRGFETGSRFQFDPTKRETFLNYPTRAMNAAITTAIGRPFQGNGIEIGQSDALSGNAQTGFIVQIEKDEEYLFKFAFVRNYEKLKADYEGIQEIHQTNTIRVAKPITFGEGTEHDCFTIFERIRVYGELNFEEFGKQLARMHKCTSPDGRYGFRINNYLDGRLQVNTPVASWADFWDTHRLGPILQIVKDEGMLFPFSESELRTKTHAILSAHTSCVPSLLHGNIQDWNAVDYSYEEGEPILVNPVPYYGDREVDIACSKLFYNHGEVFPTYQKEWPLPEGWELREAIYGAFYLLLWHLSGEKNARLGLKGAIEKFNIILAA